MDIREHLNRHPQLAIGLVALVAIASLLSLLWTLSPGSGMPGRLYFTVDEGETFFADSSDRLPPFEKDGRQAVRAIVYSCDGGKTRFVAYLERYTSDARSRIEAARQQGTDAWLAALRNAGPGHGKEVRKAKDPSAKWVNSANLKSSVAIMTVKCADGIASMKRIEP